MATAPLAGLLLAPPMLLVASGLFCSGIIALLVHGVSDGDQPETHQATVRVEAGALVVTSQGAPPERVERADIECGWIDDRGRAIVRRKGGRELLLAGSADHAKRLLDELGLGATERAARLPIRSAAGSLGAFIGSMFGPGAALGTRFITGWAFVLALLMPFGLSDAIRKFRVGSGQPLGIVVAGCIAIAAMFFASYLQRKLMRREVTVGTDGLSIRAGRKTEFIAKDAIRAVRDEPDVVALDLANGKTRYLVHAPGGDGLGRRIQEAFAVDTTGGAAEAALARLDRGARSLDAWKKDLRELHEHAATYRDGALASDALASVVGDPAATRERRIGAALAIAASADDAAKGRVRVAIDTCADEDLRIALEEAAAGDIDEERIAQRRATD